MVDSSRAVEESAETVPAEIELVLDPEFGDLWSGPVPLVRGRGFAPLQEIRLEVSCRDGKGRVWKSSNSFLVTAEGVFGTDLTASVGDDYYGISPEAPFNSMRCMEGPGHDFCLDLPTIEYLLECYEGKEKLWSQELSRHLTRAPEHLPPPWAEVVLFDDEAHQRAAAALAAHGVKTVARDEPASQLPRFIVGSGRASARALETAIRTPAIRAVILFSGGGLRFDPLVFEQPLGHIVLDHTSLRPRAGGVLITRTMYAEAVADKAKRELGRIEVEKIACPIILFSGADDQIWPASAFSELVAQRRKTAGCPHPTRHRTFEGVGHDLGPSQGLPTLPTSERTVGHPETGFRLLLGGKMGRQGRARRECWEALLAILAEGSEV